ncbi:hypothetical protein N2152v2_010961 [Parachlorella kessleri]
MVLLLFFFLLIGASAPAFGQGCFLLLGANSRTFDGCLSLTNLGSNANLMWTLSSNGDQVTWGLNTTTDGYVGFGFGTAMVGSNAFILQPCDECPTGAKFFQVFMAGTASGTIHPSDTIPTQDVAYQAGPRDWLTATFTTPLVAPATAFPILFSGGGIYRNGAMRYHSKYSRGVLNLLTGELSNPENDSKPIPSMVAAHIWLLIVGWGFLAPLGIVIARSLKSKDPLWFKLHRAVMTLGLLMGIVGLALGFVVAGGWDGIFPVHRNLGLASIILGFLQATAWVFRPQLSSGIRRGWNLWHCGLCNIISVGAWSWGVYTAVFAVICLIAIGKESWQYLQLPPPALMTKDNFTSWRPTLTGVDVELPYKQKPPTDRSTQDGHGSLGHQPNNGDDMGLPSKAPVA